MENIIINMCHEKRPFRRKSSLPNIVFAGAMFSYRGSRISKSLQRSVWMSRIGFLMFFLQGTRNNWESESTPAMCEICDLRFQAIQNQPMHATANATFRDRKQFLVDNLGIGSTANAGC